MIKIFNNRTSKKNFDRITIEYKSKTINFNGKGAIKLGSPKKEKLETEEQNLFTPINDYFDLVLDERTADNIFGLFAEAKDILENGDFSSYKKEIQRIEPILFGLVTAASIPKLMTYIESSKHMVIPPGLDKPNDNGYYPKETTFVSADYIELVKTTMAMRIIYPVLFGLVMRLESLTGTTRYAELVCGGLIQRLGVITETAGWKRLTGYVNHSFRKYETSTTTQVEIGNSEYSMVWTLYRVVFNRLMVTMIPEQDPTKTIINGISSEMKQFENNQGGYRAKKSRREDEDNQSFIEEYDISEEIPMTKITAAAEYFSFGLFDDKDQPRYKDRFKYQCKGLGINNEQLVEDIYDRLPATWMFQKTRPMIFVLQLAYAGKGISERIFDFCNYHQLLSAVCLAQVSLAERGYIYLPSLLCAQENFDLPAKGNSYMRLSADDIAQLTEICDVQAKNNEGISFNECIIYLKEFLEHLERRHWKSNLEYGVLSNPELYNGVKKGELFEIEVEPEIKQELMRLIMDFNKPEEKLEHVTE